MAREPTTKLLEPYLKVMVEKQASDLYFVTGAPPNMKTQGQYHGDRQRIRFQAGPGAEAGLQPAQR